MTRKHTVIDPAMRADIRAARAKGDPFRTIAAQFGISFSAAHRITSDIAPGHRTKGKFRHLYWPSRAPTHVKRPSRCDLIAGEIRAARQSGLTFRQIAKRFGISIGSAFEVSGDIKNRVHRTRYDAMIPNVIELREHGASYGAIAEQCDLPRSVVYNMVKRWERGDTR
jgi:transposase